MPKKADKPVANEENTAPAIDPQKQHLLHQFGGLMDQVGDGYGGPLQEELIRRLEETIANFDDEVSEMLIALKENSEKRHERLKEIWDNPEAASDGDGGDSEGEEIIPGGGKSPDSGSGEISEWEKRLESMNSGGDSGKSADPPAEEEKPKKKKGLFGLRKK